jgi:hypothetical protein
MKTHLVIGYLGEVGSAIYELLKDSNYMVYGQDKDFQKGFIEDRTFDFLHVCINDSKDFVKIVLEYMKRYCEEKTIVVIHSTVEPFTTEKIMKHHDKVAYSPVKGKHPRLKEHLQYYPKYFATTNEEIVNSIREMFESIGVFSVSLLEDTKNLEWSKHFNTLLYAHLIMFTQEVIRLADFHDLNKETIFDFIKSTGDRTLLPYAQKIGGHCVIPNAKVLSKYTPIAEFIVKRDELFGAIYIKEKKYFKNSDKSFETDPCTRKFDFKTIEDDVGIVSEILEKIGKKR